MHAFLFFFTQEAAIAALKASGNDTNLAAEYCVTGIPNSRGRGVSSPPPPTPTSSHARSG
ncbi:unnamed protein product, partial [Choristocarpus tenellus]